MRRIFLSGFLILVALGTDVWAQDKRISLAAEATLQEIGFLQYVVPRFSLKTGVKVDIQAINNNTDIEGFDVVLSARGPDVARGKVVPLMQGQSKLYYVVPNHLVDTPGDRPRNSRRFVNWLLSDIGQRTIERFEKDGEQVFFRVAQQADAAAKPKLTGDIALGEVLSFKNCGRCHVIDARNRMQGLGSTPSFALLRGFDDWLGRFGAFYDLNPHPSFSQIAGITDPFDPMLPPPIHPLAISQEDLESILAYVATIVPVDLGKPLEHQ